VGCRFRRAPFVNSGEAGAGERHRTRQARETAGTSLEELAAELAARGFQTRLTAPEGRVPSFAVTNREAVMLTETVLADATSFWWPWADRIAGVADVAAAADVIARVLAAGPGGGRA
jgi:hypothetical protein